MTTAYQSALIRQAVQDVWNEGWTARKNRCGPVFTILPMVNSDVSDGLAMTVHTCHSHSSGE